MLTPLEITQGFYISDSLPVSHQQCTNLRVNILQVEGGSEKQLFGTDGIEQVATSGVLKQINRGARTKNGIPYFVNGTTLYRLDMTTAEDGTESFTLVALGTVAGLGFVSMADNGVQLMILSPGGSGYIYNESVVPAFAEITDSDFNASGAPQLCQYIDGYFAVTTDSKKWIVSSLNDGLSWNALDFSSAESDPDNIVAPIVVNNQMYIVGSETTEGVQNIGGSGFPFQRNGVFLDKGCTAPFTLIRTNSTFFMVGAGAREGSAIWKFAGNSFSKISTSSIDTIVQSYTLDELYASLAWSYSSNGAYYVGFSFPDRTFVFDLVTELWHERKSTLFEEQSRWRPNSVIAAYNKILVGDSIDGRIGVVNPDTLTEYDSDMIRVFTTQPFTNKGDEITSTILELTMESGRADAEVENPTVGMSMSKDGVTFGAERVRKVGKIGNYTKRIIFRKNGRFDRRVVLLFRISDPIRVSIIRLAYE